MSSMAGSIMIGARCGDDAQRRLGDVDRVVAHALQVARDLDGADDEAQVAAHRLLQRQQRDGEVLDLDLEVVDIVVAANDRVGLFLVAREQRVHCEVDQFLGARGHVGQALLERCQLRVEMAFRDIDAGHPNLPVM